MRLLPAIAAIIHGVGMNGPETRYNMPRCAASVGEKVPLNVPRFEPSQSDRMLHVPVKPIEKRSTGTDAALDVALKTARYLFVEFSASAVHTIRLLVRKSWRLWRLC